MAILEVLPKRFDILDANDTYCSFRINIDVLNECFGAGRSSYRNACFPQGKNKTIAGVKSGDKFLVWMPKLYGNSSEWKNFVADNGDTIKEIAEPSRHSDWTDDDKHPLDTIRLVFVKPTPSRSYQFIGAFVTDKMEYLNHTYKRIATRVKLIGNPVCCVELLDDRRRSQKENYDGEHYQSWSSYYSENYREEDASDDSSGKEQKPVAKENPDHSALFPVGCSVLHSSLGFGTVTEVKNGKIRILFDDGEEKTLALDFCLSKKLLTRGD